MPSRQLTSNNHRQTLLAPLAAATITFSLLLFLAFLYRKLTLSRTAPAPLSTPDRLTAGKPPEKPKHLRRFKFSALKKSTASFSPENRLGQGGFGSVYRAVVPKTREVFAVKVMDSIGSIQGEREFQNEIALANRVISAGGGGCRQLVEVVGYAAEERRRGEHQERKVIVYEFMCNGSLQEKLLDKKCLELCVWEKRRKVIVDIAKALRFLHFNCGNSAVIHGDVKPSNVLLDSEFNAKLGDFGLARILDDDIRVLIENNDNYSNNNSNNVVIVDDNCNLNLNGDAGSIVEEEDSVSVMTGEQSGFSRENSLVESVESGKKKGSGLGLGSGRDYWWWKQGGDDPSSGRVKDYVMEWIGSEINKEIPKTSDVVVGNTKKTVKKKKKKRLDWRWGSLDGEDKLRKKGRKPPREWWREEFCEELSKKNKKMSEKWWQKDEEFVAPERKKRKKSKTSFGSIDWWLDGFSGEIRGCGDVPKSGGISSTPSMRGTVCYIAPEYGGGGQLSEKCDVYSFGVLVLVVISGRRPLQVLGSPMSEFERANLVSWARQLAHNGKLLDLVDSSIQGLVKEQAMVCITIALLCLQRSPCKRPNMKEIVEMLTGEVEPPHLPFEFSPSPPTNFPFKSRKKGR